MQLHLALHRQEKVNPFCGSEEETNLAYGAERKFSQRTTHWPLSGKPGAFRFGAESQPVAIIAAA